MDYKTKSIITISVIFIFMVVIAVFINNINNQVTGAAAQTLCKCTNDKDCDDSNDATKDICLYAGNCNVAKCIHEPIK